MKKVLLSFTLYIVSVVILLTLATLLASYVSTGAAVGLLVSISAMLFTHIIMGGK